VHVHFRFATLPHNKLEGHMNTKDLLAKLELIEVQARVTLSLAQEIRQMLTARPDLEATVEMPREALERKKAA
jgi:hypothetical protein